MSEQQRNPYEPTKAPLEVARAPDIEGEPEYGGFWIRFGAFMLDGLFLLPIGLLGLIGFRVTLNYFIYACLPVLVFHAFYWMYLVWKFGGTPGKRLLKMRISMADGAPVTLVAAVIRNAPIFLLGAVNAFAQLVAARSLAGTDISGMGILEVVTLMNSAIPRWAAWASTVSFLWYLATAIVMVTNDRRRALHDFFAGTVVLREQR